MERLKKCILIIISIVFCFTICVFPTYAFEQCFSNPTQKFPESPFSDLEITTEYVKIDETLYRYEYSFEDETRIIVITNMDTLISDTITYNPILSYLTINDQQSSQLIKTSTPLSATGITADGWNILSTASNYISWAQGTTVAVVAGAISIYIGIKTSYVIAAIGIGSLGMLAACCSGGAVYYELHMYSASGVPTQYRYKWSFTANTGDSYGPYYTTV